MADFEYRFGTSDYQKFVVEISLTDLTWSHFVSARSQDLKSQRHKPSSIFFPNGCSRSDMSGIA
jgi:hypothetical protein